MTTLFKREVKFKIGKTGSSFREIRDLRIDFEVEKTTESHANKGKVLIYNLSKDSRNALKDEGLKYELSAGYAGLDEIPLVGVLSSGDVSDLNTTRSGPDFITTIKIFEGNEALNKTIDKSFAEGVSLKTIVNSMTQAMGVSIGAIKGLKDTLLNSGYSATGKIKDRLDELLSKQGLEWNIQNGELLILPKGESTNELAVNLTSNTGLLKAFREKIKIEGSPQLIDILKFEALLNPEIKIGRLIQITTRDNEIKETLFKVRKIRYTGTNKDGVFNCIGEAVPI